MKKQDKIKNKILKLNWKLKNTDKCPYTIIFNIAELKNKLNK
mgnify:CR=1 FL=1